MARGKKTGGRVKGGPTKGDRLDARLKERGVDVETFFVDTMMGRMTCGKCLGKKRQPGIGARGGELKKGTMCDRCAGTGHEILEPAPRLEAAGELYARIAAKLRNVELGNPLQEGKGTVTLAQALASLAAVR